MSNLYPYRVSAYDAAAIQSVLSLLIANQEPPRIDVTRVHSDFLNRPPYPGGRLCLRGPVLFARAPGEVSAFITFYVCARYGRAIPVREFGPYYRGGGAVPIAEYDAPFGEFSCLANAPWNPGNADDGYRATYDAALSALAP